MMINAERAVERCERLAKIGPPPPVKKLWHLRRWLTKYRAIMAMDISEFSEVLRSLYDAKSVEEMAMRPRPTMSGRLEKA